MTADPDAALRRKQHNETLRREGLTRADPDAALTYDIPDCHCQHITGGRCMFAATASPGLDVERLARAMRTYYSKGDGHVVPLGLRDKFGLADIWPDLAEGITREYAALAADRETP